MSAFKDRSGERHGLVKVLRRGPDNKWGHAQFWCQCDCGSPEYLARAYVLQHKGVTHCNRCKAVHLRKPDAGLNRVFKDYRRGAKKRGLEWNLSKEQFRELTSSPCYYTGRMPSRAAYSSSRKNRSDPYIYNGIDRKDSSLGYTIENCVPCDSDVNLMKMNIPHDEFVGLVREISRHLQLGY